MLLELKNIESSYGNIKALKGVNLSVPEGKIVTLIGANGAGKSTTMKTIMGVMKPVAGDVLFKGESIVGKKPFEIVRGGVVLVPEGRQILQNMSVRENLELGAFQRKDKAGISEDLSKVFERFPRLFERQNQFGGTLSGGEQQMLAMGRALMSAPKLMMLDEPSMGLAPILVEQVFDIIQSLHKAGTTILLVEQNAQMALSIADRAYVLENGKVSLSGTGEELAKSEQVQKAYLGG